MVEMDSTVLLVTVALLIGLLCGVRLALRSSSQRSWIEEIETPALSVPGSGRRRSTGVGVDSGTLGSERGSTLGPTPLLFVLALACLGSAFAERPAVGRNNPLLRAHFLQRCLDARAYTDAYGRTRYIGNLGSIEQQADRLVGDFLATVKSELGILKEHLEETRRSQKGSCSAAATSSVGPETWARLKKSLKAVAKQSNHLRNTLASVLTNMDRKINFRPTIDTDARQSGFASELEYIEDHVLKAERRIEEYFFQPTHTVNLQDLQEGNMMIDLYRAQKMSERVLRELES